MGHTGLRGMRENNMKREADIEAILGVESSYSTSTPARSVGEYSAQVHLSRRADCAAACQQFPGT